MKRQNPHDHRVITLFPARRTPGADRLREAFRESGLSQEEAAVLVGRSGRQLRKWLTGDSPVVVLDLLVLLEERAASKRRAA